MDAIRLHVTEPDQAREVCGRVYYPHRLTVLHDPVEDTARIQAWTDDVNRLWNMLGPVEARVESARRMADYTRYLQASTPPATRSRPPC